MQNALKILCAALLPVYILPGCDAVHYTPARSGSEKIIEVAVFEGGYGIDWHQKIAARYSDMHAADGIRINLWGDPRAVEKIKPRLLRGDPPDVLDLFGFPVWVLIGAGKLSSFTGALERPAYGTNVPWRDLFIKGTLDTFTSDGQVYAIPSALSAWACWYDTRMFRKHGWSVPKTWSEFDDLCKRIRAAGIAPVAFQGKYPSYAWNTFVALVQRCGGLAAINRLNAMEPGAFTGPDVVRAARLLQEMALKHFQKGAMAMTHTESQLQFVNGQAALIWCGLWLENEMKNSTPPDFEMRCFNLPAVEGGKGNPDLFCGEGAELIFVPSDARHPEEAIDFCRYLVSLENAPDMAKSIGVISPLKGAMPPAAVSPTLQSVLEMMKDGPGIFTCRLPTLLMEWNNQILNPALAALLRGETTPDVFCRRMEDGVAAARANPDIVIPPYVPYDPAAFGEEP